MNGLKQRAKTLVELAENAAFYVASRKLTLDAKSQELIEKGGRELILGLMPKLETQENWAHDALQALCKEHGEAIGQKLGNVAGPLRSALTGRTISPSVFEVMEVLGKEESLGRLQDVC
ncbi:MAG: hypothetical protein EBR02_07325 [Alphaproteobacteria bacterium]|nr:hypothetical protein [Alphaproteobacteria bacterium]